MVLSTINETKKTNILESFSSCQSLLMALGSSSSEGILVVQCDTGEVVAVNGQLEKLFNVETGKLVGKGVSTCCNLLGPALENADELARQMYRYLEIPESCGRALFNASNSESAPIRGYVAPVRDAAGVVTAKIWSFSKMAAYSSWSKKLDQTQKMETTTRLASGFVHDTNNLLSVISAQLEFAVMSLDGNSEALEAVKCAGEVTDTCSKLMRNLLKLTRNQTTNFEEVPMEEVLEETKTLIHAAAGPKVTLGFDCEPDLQPVLGHAQQLSQCIMNLAFNALDAMPSGGILDIHLFQKCDRIFLSVADSGTGISKEAQEKLFEPLYTTKEKGTGLGLYCTARAIRDHGGSINCHSSLGKGATFLIELPVARNSE